jgi:hypothetical protein
MPALPSVVISSYLTFQAIREGQYPTITFTNGATAGHEVVTVNGISNITVQIESGVTTMLQVQTAINNSIVTSGLRASDLVSVAITSGHNSDTVQTVVNAVLSGAVTAPVAPPSGYLGRASSFSILAQSAVTNTGNTTLTGDLGITPGTSITGFPPGTFAGVLHQTDTAAANALTDANAAVATLTAMGPGTDLSSTDLNGYTAVPGVYHMSSAATWSATGDLTLNGAGLYVFLVGSSLTMGANCHVVLTNGATANNVYFITGTFFTFGANCTVNGNILAGSAVTFASNSILNGRAVCYGPSGTSITFPSAGVVTTTPYAPGVSPATNAFAIIGPVRYDAVAAGTAGNSISVSYTDGAVAGSEIVTVVGNAISVQVSDAAPGLEKWMPDTYSVNPASQPQQLPRPGIDYTDAAQIIAAIRGSVAASALVNIEYWIVGTPAPVYADAAESPARFLTGGTNGAPATVTVEGLTVTSITNDATQNGATLTLTTGATAGAEVVTMFGNNISVQIQNGVSTVTQVRAALNASTPFIAKYAAAGTSATPMYTVNALLMA